MRRVLVVFGVLVTAYTAAVLLDAGPGAELSAPEAHVLLTAESIVSDADADLRDEYFERAWDAWYPRSLEPTAIVTGGRLHEPHGVALPLLLAPGWALGEVDGARLESALLLALAFALAAALGARLLPDPWPVRGALAAGLSPPAIGVAVGISPVAPAAALIAGAALLALRMRNAPHGVAAFVSAGLAAALPWLAASLVLPAAVIAGAVARWLRRRRRGLAGFAAFEVLLASAVVYVTVNERLFGGLTPGAAALPGAGDPPLPPWLPLTAAPLAALVGVAGWLLWRSHRDRLALAVADQVDVEVTALLFLALCGAAGVAAALGEAQELALAALPCVGALCAWALRAAPRAGAALVLASLAASVALAV